MHATRSIPMPGSRPGVTLVEMLVVIGCIAALLALLVPAVQGARESARLTRCGSNLRQIGIAVAAHEQIRQLLPTTVTSGTIGAWDMFDPRAGSSHSWLVQILPQLDEQPLYDRFDLRDSVFSPRADGGRGPQAERLATLLCPSDPGGGQGFADDELTAGLECGRGNYAAWASPYHVEYQHAHPGVLAWRQRPRLTDVTDGLQSALMATEIKTGRQRWDARGAWAIGWNGTCVLAYDMHPAEETGRFRHSLLSLGHTQRPNVASSRVNVDVLYACPDPRGAERAGMPCASWAPFGMWHYLSSAPRSFHRGGVQALWADGRVTFLTDDVDEIVMAYALGESDGRGDRVAAR